MTSIASYGAALWLPAAVSAQSQDTSNWITQSLQPSASSLGLPQSTALQAFMDTAAAVADTFASAQTNRAQGLAALAIQAVNDRVYGEVQKQIDELANSTSQPSAPTATATIYLADGSILNAAKNTFTLADGTVLDITTGMKVVGAVVNLAA